MSTSSKKYTLATFSFFLLFSATSSCTSNTPISTQSSQEITSISQLPSAGFSSQTFVFNTHSDDQEAFLTSSDYQQWLINHEVHGQGSNDRPKPVSLTWNDVSDHYRITLSKNADYSNPIVYEVSRNKVDIHNLEINTPYHVKLEYGESGIEENMITVQCYAPRILYITGVNNFRDEGGYPLENGKFTKQGLIYRAARPNSISQKGMNVLYEELKLKTEIDLQTIGEVGEEGFTRLTKLNYQFCPMSGVVNDSENDDSVRKVFSIFSSQENYPVYFHCAIGTDRTGYIGFLLNALLGVSYDYCLKDYLLSNFAPIGGQRSLKDINYYLNPLLACEGNTLQEKCESYLMERYQIPLTQIEAIRSIMIQD